MGIEILHERDPDTPCSLRVWLDGEEAPPSDVTVKTVDPGAGHTMDDWDETTDFIASNVELSPAFKAAVLGAREQARDSEYIVE